ncbi:cytochrome P450 6B1 [Nasonia vitripennis]|uniref:Cytochrome P450 n=1 Tax=Nasonia vitripennis TaxID=7425 RepID=A0A7M7QR94_NASVI|nr:cytochrome P450 6B1 [Nasonia vitripennis]
MLEQSLSTFCIEENIVVILKMIIESFFCVVCILTISLAISFYYFLTWNFDFWKKRNVKGPEPVPFFGNYKDNIFGKIHSTELTKRFYDEFANEKMVGIYVYGSPVLILRDLDLIRDVLIKDFAAFSDRGIRVHDRVEPLSQHFFNLPVSTWRPLRKSLTPAFSCTRMKGMFELMAQVAELFVSFLEQNTEREESLECCALVAKFATEVIGECGFGSKMGEFEDKVSEFREVSKTRIKSNLWNFVRRNLRQFWPSIYKYCSMFCNKKLLRYYVNMINSVNLTRSKEGIKRKDYVEILLHLKNNPEQIQNLELSDSILAAQSYVFFTAGSDTTALIISNLFYELAVNESIQDRLREEIQDQKLSYHGLKSMEYLDKVWKETLRKYPLRNIQRASNQIYTFSKTNVTIPANTQIIIPNYAIHYDSQYYHEPEVFNPERFDGRGNFSHPMIYLPFGKGPRDCIGSQFAVHISKILIVKVLENFKVEISSESLTREENDPRQVLLSPKGGIRLKFKRL